MVTAQLTTSKTPSESKIVHLALLTVVTRLRGVVWDLNGRDLDSLLLYLTETSDDPTTNTSTPLP